MAQADAELYLRLTGERMVLDGDREERHGWDSPVAAAGHALASLGVLPAGVAQAIVDDYQFALAYRNDEYDHFLAYHSGSAPPSAPTSQPAIGPVRAVACRRVIDQPWGQLETSYLLLSERSTRLHVRLRRVPAPAAGRSGSGSGAYSSMLSVSHHAVAFGSGGGMFHGGMPGQLTLADDRGTTVTADFSGGGDDSEWTGDFEAQSPLATDTAWIEVLGERIELAGEPPAGVEVRLEPLAEQDPARRYLWTMLAAQEDFHNSASIEAAIGALVAAGVLAADDPAVGEARAVMDHQFGGRGAGRGHGPLPQPWRSMARGAGRAGPVGLIVVGATTPQFDGITAAVLAVESDEDGFTAEVELAPDVAHRHMFRSRVDEPVVVWWAADDRGRHYLGRQGSWSGSEESCGGQIEFSPGLDPAARRLDLMPTTTSMRAVIQIPLSWGGRR